MISYFFYDIIPILTISYRFLPFLRYHHAISNTISYHTESALISVSYDKSHGIRAYNPWNGPLISVTSDITAMWYHGFHDMFAYIMAPARRDGAGWGRQLPGAPLPLASPSPTCWAVSGDCCSAERRRPWSRACTCCSRCCKVSSLRWKFSSWTWLQVRTYELLHICSHLAQVGHLVVAGLPHCAQDWVTDSHTGLPRSPPDRLRFQVTVSLAQPDSRCDWQMAVVYKRSVPEFVHVTARALIIEIQLNRVPLQIT